MKKEVSFDLISVCPNCKKENKIKIILIIEENKKEEKN